MGSERKLQLFQKDAGRVKDVSKKLRYHVF